MTTSSACISCGRTLNRIAVRYRKWAQEYAASGQHEKAAHWAKEARTRFEDAQWYIGRARRLSDG